MARITQLKWKTGGQQGIMSKFPWAQLDKYISPGATKLYLDRNWKYVKDPQIIPCIATHKSLATSTKSALTCRVSQLELIVTINVLKIFSHDINWLKCSCRKICDEIRKKGYMIGLYAEI